MKITEQELYMLFNMLPQKEKEGIFRLLCSIVSSNNPDIFNKVKEFKETTDNTVKLSYVKALKQQFPDVGLKECKMLVDLHMEGLEL